MARLLAAWELGLANGHVACLAPVARALGERRHESWLAARDVVTPAALADRPFARVLQAPLWLRSRIVAPTLSYGQVIADAGFADDDGLIELVRAWLALFDLVQPAALYADHAPAALLAAHVARLPAARLGSGFTCPPALRPGPALMPWRDVPAAQRAGADAVADRVVRGVCRYFGAPALDGLAELLATAPAFLASWPEISGAARSDASHYGPLGGLGALPPPDWPLAPGPRLMVYLAFDHPAAAGLANALAARGWPVIWVSAVPPAASLPANIRHEAEPIDIAMALHDATLFVGRGSHGTSLAAVRAGCSQLMLPETVEARTNALALASQRLGRIAPAWDAATLGALIDAMARADAPEHAAAAAAAARHADYDPVASARRLAADLLAALRLD